LGAALAGVVALAGCPSAWADVTITPSQAVQGAGARVTFLVPDDRGRVYTTKVQVQLPAQAPVGEVDPMSVPDWAPMLTYRNLATPVPGIHSAAISTIATAITWTRIGKPASGELVNKLSISMGPLPYVNRLPFTVLQTYSDHTVRRWSAAAGTVLTLTAAKTPAGAATASPGASSQQGMQGMAGMEGMPGMGATVLSPTGSANPQAVAAGSTAASTPVAGSLKILDLALTGGVLVVFLTGAGVVARNRRRAGSASDSPSPKL
jgi:uncharacterized protein YcnI